eukprot:2730558-Prymnesium_polylepis.1
MQAKRCRRENRGDVKGAGEPYVTRPQSHQRPERDANNGVSVEVDMGAAPQSGRGAGVHVQPGGNY